MRLRQFSAHSPHLQINHFPISLLKPTPAHLSTKELAVIFEVRSTLAVIAVLVVAVVVVVLANRLTLGSALY